MLKGKCPYAITKDFPVTAEAVYINYDLKVPI